MLHTLNPNSDHHTRKVIMESDKISNGASKLEDPMSSLPNPTIVDILSLLPLKSAVASAALSQRWPSVWTQRTAFRHYGPTPPAIDSFTTLFFKLPHKICILPFTKEFTNLSN